MSVGDTGYKTKDVNEGSERLGSGFRFITFMQVIEGG